MKRAWSRSYRDLGMQQFIRTEALLGKENMNRLTEARVAVFGVGGVGGYVAEALARSGVGHIELIDHDTVSESNLNRQIIATYDTVGRDKVDVMKERILAINPSAEVKTRKCFYLPENKDDFDFTEYTYVVDAVDTVTAKLLIIEEAKQAGVPVISSMGTGNKLDPTQFEVTDISKTSVCPLAKVMRKELRDRGIMNVKVLYSKEPPIKPGDILAENKDSQEDDVQGRKKAVPGSISFVPSVAGLIIAAEVVKDICSIS